jgi:SAM-dependent methyltransferase
MTIASAFTSQTVSRTAVTIDAAEVERKVKEMYRDVAENPFGDYHFEMGRGLAERLGYAPPDLDRIPSASIDSFAGVGFFFAEAALEEGERVVDFGSGSGMDTFIASLKVGATGDVTGIDMSDDQLAKAQRLRNEAGVINIDYKKGYLDRIPCEDNCADVVISNGVINLVPDKDAVFSEAARLIRSGGRIAMCDIVSEKQLPDSITCNTSYWASCIGGAMQEVDYLRGLEKAGFRIDYFADNPEYRFISNGAVGAMDDYGVKSVTVVATRF